jgi:hypothetical protein
MDHLTEEQVRRATQNTYHPVISLLQKYESHWFELVASLSGMESEDKISESQRLCLDYLAPFVNELQSIPFKLGPLNIISIWEEAVRLFPVAAPRYALAESITCSYLTQSTNSEAWDNFYEKIVNDSLDEDYLSRLKQNKTDLIKARRKLRRLSKDNSSISLFINGLQPGEAVTLAKKAYKEGNTESERRIDTAIEREKMIIGKFPNLNELIENWNVGAGSIELP